MHQRNGGEVTSLQRLLSIAIWLGFLSVLFTSSVGATQPLVGKTSIIYKQQGVYAAFPNVFKADDGTLVVSFVTRSTTSHYDSAGGSKMLVSKDSGESWQDPDKTYLDPALRTRDGRYVIAGANSWQEATSAEAFQLEQQGVTINKANGKFFYATGANTAIKTNSSSPWVKKPLLIPSLSMLMGYNSASYLKTSRKVRLKTLYGKKFKTDKDQVFLLRSDEGARHWEFRTMFSQYPNTSIGFNETAITELPDGSILAIMRPDPDSTGYLYSSISKDSGGTWSTPQRTAIWGFPASLYVLPDKRVLCVYGYRKVPMGIRAAILNKDYVSIDGREIVIRNDAVPQISDVGYPVVIESDGKLIIIYYITTSDGITHIAESQLLLN